MEVMKLKGKDTKLNEKNKTKKEEKAKWNERLKEQEKEN